MRRAQSDRGSVRILEVGPGTGAVTRHIVPLLKAGDHLDLVEVNAAFVDVLNRRFGRGRAFRGAAGSAEIHPCPIQEFHPTAGYDFVISGLPLNNCSAELAREILDHVFELMQPGATLSYFEYMYVRDLRKRTAQASEKRRLKELDETLAGYLDRYRIRRDRVLLNIPPAWVQHLRKPPRGGHG